MVKPTYNYIQLTNDGRFQVDKYGSRYMLASSSFAKEGVERVVSATNGLVTWHLTIRLNTVLQAVKLPAGVADLNARLSNVDGDALTLNER